jgi:hypothetical protein
MNGGKAMRIVHQKGEDGCGIACVAMAAGTTYQKAKDNLPKYWESVGTTKKQMLRGLRKWGIATGKPTRIGRKDYQTIRIRCGSTRLFRHLLALGYLGF